MLKWFSKLPIWGKVIAFLFLWPFLGGALIWKIKIKIFRYSALVLWVIFVFAVLALASPSTTTSPVASNTESNAKIDAPKTETPKPSDEEIKAQEEEKRKPDVAISGSIEPALVSEGEKVVIKVNVENKDKTKTLKGVRLKFLNSDFVKDGLVIVNVIGGSQEGNEFIFDAPGMDIEPGGKRVLNIVAVGKQRGNFESSIMVTPILGKEKFIEYNFPDKTEMLGAKLTII